MAGWILELSNGKGIPFEGNYSDWWVTPLLPDMQHWIRDAAVAALLAGKSSMTEWARDRGSAPAWGT